MRLRNNSFQGSLPAEYSKLPLSVFDASSNQFSGALPAQYAAWKGAKSLAFSSNMLTGTIPPSWSEGMPLLQSLVLYNNSLSGTIPSATPFPSLNVFSINLNSFSGTLPSFSTWPQMQVLDVQNNSQLAGPIVLPPLLTVIAISVCSTQLCAAAGYVGVLYLCLPNGNVLEDAVVAGVITSLVTVLDRCTISTPTLCSVTTLAPSIIPSRQNNASRESSPTSSIITISGVTTAAALGAALTAIDAADLQMLVSVLGSPCVCSTTATTQRSVLLLALSPFSPLGSAWAAIGNSLLCCVLVFVHLLAVYIVTSYSATTQVIQQRTPSSKRISLNTLLGRWLRKDATRSSSRRRKVLAQLRFPNISVTLLLLLVPGVVRACMAASNSLHNSSNDDDAGESLALSAVAIAVGVVFVLCAYVFVELVAYRHANAEVISRNLRVYEDPHA